MKNVIKFPLERQRKDLMSDQELANQLRTNKMEFCTEIASHYGTLIYNKLSMHGFDTTTKEFAKDYYFMTNALKSALFRSVGLKDDIQDVVDNNPEYDEFMKTIPDELEDE
tara:strand:+ start:275 stop:607 length:333 start_codon:yes stop_codon:yes gene_type:complete